MILHRSRGGVISSMYLSVVLRAGAKRQRVTSAAFREGALDGAILDAFDLKALVEALARETISTRGLWIKRGSPPADRPAVQRTWSFGRGDARCLWIRGRGVSATSGDERYESTFDAHLAEGFPPKLAEALGAETVDAVRAAVLALKPLECFCGTNAEASRACRSAEDFDEGMTEERPCSEETLRRIIADEPESTGLDVYHAIMGAIGYATASVAAGQLGLRVFKAFEGTNLPRFRRYRAAFRAMAGDRAGALEDEKSTQ